MFYKLATAQYEDRYVLVLFDTMERIKTKLSLNTSLYKPNVNFPLKNIYTFHQNLQCFLKMLVLIQVVRV